MSFTSGELLTEKNPAFKPESRIEGNLSVVVHPSNPSMYGDGSVEVGGILSTDTLASATPNSYIQVSNPLSFVNQQPPPSPLPGLTQLYADQTTGHLTMSDDSGHNLDLMPLTARGDLITLENTPVSQTVAFPAGKPGDRLIIDPVSNPHSLLRWKGPEFSSADQPMAVEEDSGMSIMQASGPGTKLNVGGSSTPVTIMFAKQARCSPIAFQTSPDASYVTLLKAGLYFSTCKLVVAAVAGEARGILEITDGTGGYVGVQGGSMISFENDNDSRTLTLYTEVFIGGIVANTRFRVRLSTPGSSSSFVPVESAALSIAYIPVSKVTTVTGGTGTAASGRQIIQCNDVILDTSGGSATGGGIQATSATAGPQRLFGRVGFTDETKGDMDIVVNGASVASAPILNGYGCTWAFVTLNENDTVALSARTSDINATASLDPAQTILTSSAYGTKWDAATLVATTPIGGTSLSVDVYTFLTFVSANLVVTSAPEHTSSLITDCQTPFRLPESSSFGSSIVLGSGGTYQVILSAIATPGTLICLYVRDQAQNLLNPVSANAEVQGGSSEAVLVFSSFVTLPPNTAISFGALGANPNAKVVSACVYVLQTSSPVHVGDCLQDFGTHYAACTNDAETITTAGSLPTSIVSFTTKLIAAGTYRFSWSVECDVSAPSVAYTLQFWTDGQVREEAYKQPLNAGTYDEVSSTSHLTFNTDAVHSVTLNLRVQSGAVRSRHARFSMFRVA